jgi:UDP-N-acetylmuramyl pentapeptide synthase
LLAVGEFAQTTAQAAKTNASHPIHTECFEDAAAICDNLETFIEHDDVVLVKGSRAAGLETVVAKIRELVSRTPLLKADTN